MRTVSSALLLPVDPSEVPRPGAPAELVWPRFLAACCAVDPRREFSEARRLRLSARDWAAADLVRAKPPAWGTRLLGEGSGVMACELGLVLEIHLGMGETRCWSLSEHPSRPLPASRALLMAPGFGPPPPMLEEGTGVAAAVRRPRQGRLAAEDPRVLQALSRFSASSMASLPMC